MKFNKKYVDIVEDLNLNEGTKKKLLNLATAAALATGVATTGYKSGELVGKKFNKAYDAAKASADAQEKRLRDKDKYYQGEGEDPDEKEKDKKEK